MRIQGAVVCACVAGLFTLSAYASAHALKLKSPDRHIALALSIHDGRLQYQVALDGRTVMVQEPLDLHAAGATAPAHPRFGSVQRYRIDDAYPWYGIHSEAREQGSGLHVAVQDAHCHEAYQLEARAYNNGIAFRMILPGEQPRVPMETVGFHPVKGSKVWSFDPTAAHYEGVYQENTASALPSRRFMAPPVVVELPNNDAYLAITEGRLQNYPGMVLQSDGAGTFFARPGNEVPADKALIYFDGKATAQRLAIPAAISGTIVTPWRIVMIAKTLNSLVNNDIVSDVADPPNPAIFPEGIHTPWIRPGRAVWKYLDGGPRGLQGTEELSHEAQQLGFQYQILEGYWQHWTEAELKSVVDEARRDGIGIWLWKNRSELGTRASREAFFSMCNRTGVVGVKIDFFDSEAKEVVDLYQSILEEAAQHHLLVDFHGADKPTGEQRTWPNELTREAVEGMEYCCIPGTPDAPRARHAVTLPFTRLLAGPADYTPMLFDKGLNGTTWANQIASAVILTSPLLTYAANPATILANPAVDLIRDIPATWDETIVLPPSKIGQLAVFARRRGDRWFLAAMNGDTPQSVHLSLGFLGSGSWRAETAGDVPAHPAAVHVQQETYRAGDTMSLSLEAGGGYVAEFTQR